MAGLNALKYMIFMVDVSVSLESVPFCLGKRRLRLE